MRTMIIVQIFIAATAIISAWYIARYQIQEGRKLNAENLKINEENAGKNRVIYSTEQMNVSQDNKLANDKLKSLLNSGNYTILSAFVNSGNTTETRYVLGKIKP